MRWREPLDEILGSRSRVRVLRCLARAEAPLTGREIARRTGVSHTGVLNAVRELLEQDVVAITSDGTGFRYRLDRDHELVLHGIQPLLALESSLESRLTNAVREVVPTALSIVLFGSVSRGDDEATSDVDVLVVVPDEEDPELASDAMIEAGLSKRFGKTVNAIVWTKADLLQHDRRRLPLLHAILKEGRLVEGESLRVLLASSKVRRVAG